MGLKLLLALKFVSLTCSWADQLCLVVCRSCWAETQNICRRGQEAERSCICR